MQNHTAHNSLLPFILAHEIDAISKYNLCFSYQLSRSDYVPIIIENLLELIMSKAYLRQTFMLDGNQVKARIHDNLPAKIEEYTISVEEFPKLQSILINEQHDINNSSSIKLNVIYFTDKSKLIMLFNIHHILLDGTGLEHFINDLNHLISGKTLLKQDSQSYLKLLHHEHGLLEMDESQLNNELLTSYVKSIDRIMSDIHIDDNQQSSTILHYSERMPRSIISKLAYASTKYSLSKFNLLLLAWSIFNAKMNNQDSNVVLFPISIRCNKEISGCLINNIIFPLEAIEEQSYYDLINELITKLPFFKQCSRLNLNGYLNLRTQSSFSNSSLAKPSDLVIKDDLIPSTTYPQIANSAISIKYREYQSELYFSADILSEIMPNFVASTLLLRFFNYLNKILDNINGALSNIDLTFPEEKRQILYDFNQTRNPFPRNETLVDLFEEQVHKTPGRVACVYENTSLTYEELNYKSNQLAHYLISHHQVKPDDLIALLLDRNEYTIIAILAVLKAGGAYVPLDLSYPKERIDYILEDTQANMIIINEGYLEYSLAHESKLSRYKNCELIIVDSYTTQIELSKFSKSNLITADTCTNLAYVIYTSGTTGRPKGVMVEHKNVINTLRDLFYIYQRDDQLTPFKSTAFTSYAFDVSVSEFFVPLLRGDELHILSNNLRKDILLISKYINAHQINYVYLPPVLLANLPRVKYSSLNAIIYAGEPCDAETANYWADKTRLYNYYGPTEASIYATGLQLQSNEVHLIGKPISNATAYILNCHKTIQPIGVVGELYLGGQGIAKGYLNQKELTEQRFIPNIFQTKEELLENVNSRLYKTGDLARWYPDGSIEYLGRSDFQIKIRGYRIELGEIEVALISYPEIKQAVVLVHEQIDSEDSRITHKFLVGYYVSEQFIEELRIKEYLSLHLPDYMQPRALIHISHLPITPNGKLDRNALPKVELSHDNYIPPTNEKETLICNAFAKVLGLAKVGIEDDFFICGGNSIMAISLVAVLQNNFNINVADVFNLKIPKKIARDILLIKNNLIKNLERIRLEYQVKALKSFDETPFHDKLDYYYTSAQQVKTLNVLPITNILLTGATGFLGCNLLHMLLTTTNYNIILLVRAPTDDVAFERINDKYQYYFDQQLTNQNNRRIFVFAGDLERVDLGVSNEIYQLFIGQVDSIIHSAALTKHYGDYDTFYSANVLATQHLLELSKLTKLKAFHYISTSSVLNEGYVPNCDYYIFSEDDDGDNLEERTNIYVRTKYEGERLVVKYRKQGVNGNIYRVGNLAFITQNHRVQENIEDNAFYTRLKCFISLGMIANEIGSEEISPVDLTAQAILKLMPIKEISNQTLHVFNPQTINLGEYFAQSVKFHLQLVSVDYFISNIIERLSIEEYDPAMELFLLHKRWLNEQNPHNTNIHILQYKTQLILKKLGFEWPSVTPNDIEKILKGS